MNTYHTWLDSPLEKHSAISSPLLDQYGRLRHAVLVSRFICNRHIEQTPFPQHVRKLVLRVDCCLADIARGLAHGGEMLGRLGGDDEDFTAGLPD